MAVREVWPKYCAEMDCSIALACDGASFVFLLVLMRRVHVLLERPPWTAQKPPTRPCPAVKYIAAIALVFFHIAFILVRALTNARAMTPSEALGSTIRTLMWTSYAVLLARNPHLGETIAVRIGLILHGVASLALFKLDTSTISSCLVCFISAFTAVLALLALAPSITHRCDSDRSFSPLDQSSLLSRLVYAWVSPFISLGLQRRFEMTDVPPLPAADRTASHMFHTALLQERRQPNPSFLRLTMRLYGCEVVGFGLWSACNKLLSLTSPFLIKEFLEWSSSAESPSLSTTGFILAGLISLQAVLSAFSGSQYGLAWARFDLRVKAGLMSAIYGRTLELTLAEKSAIGMGKITNYISVDLGRVVGMPGSVFDMVLIPLEIVIALVLLSREVSYAFVAGLGVLAVMLPLQTWLGNQLQVITRKMLQFRDERVELTSETIKGIRVLKLLAWIDHFVGKMRISRQLEMGQLGARKYLDALCVVFWASTPVIVQSSVFLAVIYSGRDLTAANAFVAIALLDRLIYPMNYFPWIVNGFLEARVSALRIREYLFAPVAPVIQPPPRPSSVCLWHQCTFAWTEPTPENQPETDALTTALLTDHDMSQHAFKCHLDHFQLDPAHMHVLVGATGSGKSSMLLALLGEMPLLQGRHIGSPGIVSYAPQVPWLFPATIRYNITLDAEDNEQSSSLANPDLYRQVLAACALEQDLSAHPHGDRTILSEQGANLSGGQRARLGLARALYQRADVYLLDDVLSSLDVATASHVLRHAFAVLPPTATVVMATHAVHLLDNIARSYTILVVEHGRVVEMGTHEDLTSRESSRFNQMAQVVRGVGTGNDNEGDAQRGDGTRRGDNLATSDHHGSASVEEHRDDGVVASWMWWRYLHSMGGVVLGMLVLSVLVMQVSRNGLDYWIALYTSAEHHPIAPLAFAHGLIVITAINIVAVTARSFFFAYGGLRAAKALYARLVHRLFHATLSFFDVTPLGRILNRLSGDTYGVDESLPFILNIFIKDFADVCGTLVILVATNPAVYFVLGPLTVVYFVLQKWYRPTSRHLRRLDAVAQSPLVMTFQATLDGLPILRGLRCEPKWFGVYLHQLYQAQRVSFLGNCTGAWFGLRLDSLGVAVTTFVAVYAAIQCHLGHPVPSGVLGLTLIYALPIVGKFNAILGSFIATEQNMVSVERVLEYSYVPVEDGDAPTADAPSSSETGQRASHSVNDHLVNWPPQGHVTLTNVSVRYGAGAWTGLNQPVDAAAPTGLPAALHGVTCHIVAKEKIGICGRTGAGKSTLLHCLFRVVPFGGRIVIDGIDISSMSLTRLRSALCFIPQDAMLFKGSVRANIDPMDTMSDAAIWTALSQCCLKEVVEMFPLQLMEPLQNNEAKLSRGQAQLLCICRALVRQSKVVCVDEATAAIDHTTEQLVKTTMAQAFKDSTVLTVAHRLHSILDSDRVLVLDEGKVVEFDTPRALRAIPNGYFAALLDGHIASSAST
ncbi:hypothetical protein H310_04845 [Aphanomyces invadans]|uniref:Uncharacterized protein n=1 Tax=Aphanomyces invadans TaxID=157072 RepID=A0A024UAR6_9STRA|nr:hypothetical protein H310_04845 [Aphanomyces invadans]ETW03354.1 hypothetical protein H310_04845 [Aphanomyces invadans]|eukprot:XP_008867583.1 hypothetical protein H310_04845 [Aphanomyces invadans]